MRAHRFRRAPTGSACKPPRLQPGMTVALVAPAGTFPEASVEKVGRLLEQLGYRVRIGNHILRRFRYLAGEDHHRAHDLWQALEDPAIHAIFCFRGGFGSSRLLSRLPLMNVHSSCKVFLGYSDVCFLHAALNAWAGWMTFHGPNALEWIEDPDGCTETLAFLEGRKAFSWSFGLEQILHPGRAKGRLVGGNLTCLTHMLGTPYAPDFDGALLFLEDKSEAPYRIDRMLVHLGHAGVFDAVKGVLCGSFVGCGDPQEIRTLIKEHILPYHIPVVVDLPFGHGRWNQVLPLGASYILDTTARHLQTVEDVFRDV